MLPPHVGIFCLSLLRLSRLLEVARLEELSWCLVATPVYRGHTT